MTLTSHEPVAQLVARSSEKISRLYVADGEPVCREQLLVVLENPAKTDDVLLLERELHAYAGLPDSLTERLLPLKELALGDIRSTYSTLLSDLHAYRNYRELDYYPQKIGSTESQLRKHRTYYALLQRQQLITADQYRLAWQQYERDSLLYIQQVLSAYEHETARSTYLQSRYSLESANASLETERIQIGQLEESLLDLRLEQMEKEEVLQQNLRTSVEQVTNAIKLPVERSGKVKVGQRVIIRFSNYPDEEFGTVEGHVASVSLVPAENNYMVEIDFPNGLQTNYGYTLPVLQEMPATAEIVTDNLRLIERFIQPVKKIWKEGMSR